MDNELVSAGSEATFKLAVRTPERSFLLPVSLEVPENSLLGGSVIESQYRGLHDRLFGMAMGAAGLTSANQVRVIQGANLWKSESGGLTPIPGNPGKYTSVLRNTAGKIGGHGKLVPADAEMAMMATACTTQILLVGIALKLNAIDNKLEDIQAEIEKLRGCIRQPSKTGLFAAIDDFRHAMATGKEDIIREQLPHSARDINKTIYDNYESLKEELGEVPDMTARWGNFWRIRSIREKGAERLGSAEDLFRLIIIGIQARAECFALMGEPELAADYIESTAKVLAEYVVDMALPKARMLSFDERPPELPWESFVSRLPALERDLVAVRTISALEPEKVDVLVEQAG